MTVERVADLLCKFLCAVMAFALFLMVILVFGNVLMRYVFSSGITVSEELSRWLFIWLTFIGAVIAVRERGHLGTDALVSRLPPMGKTICMVAGRLTMIYICWLVFQGSLEQTRINMDVLAPASQWPVALVYAAGVFFGIAAGLMFVLDLWLFATGRLSTEELMKIQESEDEAALHATPPAPSR
ncbi:TRAP transporter small permease [soil metagenome]